MSDQREPKLPPMPPDSINISDRERERWKADRLACYEKGRAEGARAAIDFAKSRAYDMSAIDDTAPHMAVDIEDLDAALREVTGDDE